MTIKENSPLRNILFLFLLLTGIKYASSCSNGEYEHWNGTCLPTCDFPFVNETDNSTGTLYCKFPCDPSETLYFNGTCSPDSCPMPFSAREEWGMKFCDY